MARRAAREGGCVQLFTPKGVGCRLVLPSGSLILSANGRGAVCRTRTDVERAKLRGHEMTSVRAPAARPLRLHLFPTWRGWSRRSHTMRVPKGQQRGHASLSSEAPISTHPPLPRQARFPVPCSRQIKEPGLTSQVRLDDDAARQACRRVVRDGFGSAQPRGEMLHPHLAVGH